jgi:hypothetical protein
MLRSMNPKPKPEGFASQIVNLCSYSSSLVCLRVFLFPNFRTAHQLSSFVDGISFVIIIANCNLTTTTRCFRYIPTDAQTYRHRQQRTIMPPVVTQEAPEMGEQPPPLPLAPSGDAPSPPHSPSSGRSILKKRLSLHRVPSLRLSPRWSSKTPNNDVDDDVDGDESDVALDTMQIAFFPIGPAQQQLSSVDTMIAEVKVTENDDDNASNCSTASSSDSVFSYNTASSIWEGVPSKCCFCSCCISMFFIWYLCFSFQGNS